MLFGKCQCHDAHTKNKSISYTINQTTISFLSQFSRIFGYSVFVSYLAYFLSLVYIQKSYILFDCRYFCRRHFCSRCQGKTYSQKSDIGKHKKLSANIKSIAKVCNAHKHLRKACKNIRDRENARNTEKRGQIELTQFAKR